MLHFPKGEKYVSLLKDPEDPDAKAHVESERSRLRALVKQQLRDDAIVNELNEGQGGKLDDVDVRGDDGFAQELKEDDFFANSSDDERDTSGSDASGSGTDGDNEDGTDDDRGDDDEIGPGAGDESTDVSSSDEDEVDNEDNGDERVDNMSESSEEHANAGAAPFEGTHRAFQKQQPARWTAQGNKQHQKQGGSRRKSIPKIKVTPKKASVKGKGKPLKKGQPLRTRAEGGRKRRPKKKAA